ncbi:hypothetical protein [Scrofimicrobium sp. R131]|uniref:Secreted protein n=1 Tax=Scrofimicrobium appendicitidis TaxID=3079930 RepID=A0AAU7V6V9_9ACTO
MSNRASIVVVGALIVVSVGACSPVVEGDSPVSGSQSVDQSTPDNGDSPMSGGSTETDAGAGSNAGVVVKDRASWSLPIDPYFSVDFSNYQIEAEQWLMRDCMAEGGWDYRVAVDASAPLAETTSVSWARLFTPELAAKYGYRRAPDPRYPLEDEIEAKGGLDSDQPQGFLDRRDVCFDQVREELKQAGAPEEPSETEQAVSGGYNVLFRDAITDEVHQAATRWRECMAPLGIVDLPEEPWTAGAMSMPPSLMNAWGWTSSFGKPSADEVRIAVHDANCRETSGWSEALYESQWDLAEKFVEDNKPALDALLQQHDEYIKKYQQIIADHQNK